MKKVVIADLGTGNLRSVSNAVKHTDSNAVIAISDNPVEIENADYLILPGQGAIGSWLSKLNDNPQLRHALEKRLQQGPVLGICIGLQALYQSSEENGGVAGLNILSGQVKKFQQPKHDNNIKIPHMGWNQVRQTQSHPLWKNINDNQRFYFVHSYYPQSTKPEEQQMGTCDYCLEFTAAAALNNIFATQFHPEKSQRAGLQLIDNFLNWNGRQ